MTNDISTTDRAGRRRFSIGLLATAVAGTLSGCRAMAQSSVEPTSDDSPLAVLQAILGNPTDLAFVRQHVTDDFTYVSLNYENADLKKVLPWTGTAQGAGALVDTFVRVGEYWTTDDFTVEDAFENADGAALFGRFTYTSRTLGKSVTSPFAVLARARGGKLSYVQFMEDTFATADSFRSGGRWRIESDPNGGSVEV